LRIYTRNWHSYAGRAALQKLETSLENNPGYRFMQEVKKTFTGEKLENPEDAQVEWSMYKHARLTSCDVERSFSW
jgi:hypothetical protein